MNIPTINSTNEDGIQTAPGQQPTQYILGSAPTPSNLSSDGFTEIAQQQNHPRKSKASLYIILIIIAIVLGGGAYAAYYFELLPGGGNLKKLKALDDGITKFLNIQSARFDISLFSGSEPRAADAYILPEQFAETLSNYPTDSTLHIDIDGVSSFVSFIDSDVELRMEADWNFSSLAGNMGIEMRKVANEMFLKLNSDPLSLPFIGAMASQLGVDLRDQWISLSLDDAAGYAGYDSIPDQRVAAGKARELLQQLYTIARNENIMLINLDVPNEQLGQMDHYIYHVTINYEALEPFIVQAWPYLLAYQQEFSPSVPIMQETPTDLIETIRSGEFQQYIDIVNQAILFKLAVNKNTNFLDYVRITFKVVLSENDSTQSIWDFSALYTDINKPIEVIKPINIIPYEDIAIKLLGGILPSEMNNEVTHTNNLLNPLDYVPSSAPVQDFDLEDWALFITEVYGLSDTAEEALEVISLLQVDLDADGIPDTVEDIFGSSNQSNDTDGDGYDDLNEVMNGYDPIISGSARLPAHRQPRVVIGYSTVLAAMNSMLPSMLLCQELGFEIENGRGEACNGQSWPIDNTLICGKAPDLGNWSTISQYGFEYDICDASLEEETWLYSASAESCHIKCTEQGCSSSGCK